MHHFLVVVQDQDTRTCLTQILEHLAPSAIVTALSSGVEARAVLRGAFVDLLVIEDARVDVSSSALITMVRTRSPSVPIILVTSSAAPETETRHDITAYVTTPVTPEVFRQIVREHVPRG